MDEKFKRIMQWTIFAIVVILVLFSIISLVVNVLGPTLFPETDISGFKNYLNDVSLFLSLFSILLGSYSIWQAYSSGKQASDMIKSIQEIRNQQELIYVIVKSINEPKVVSAMKNDSVWTADSVSQ